MANVHGTRFVIVATISRVETLLERVNSVVLVVFRWLTVGLVAVMTTIVLSGVFFRYVLNDALPWSEEIAKFLMVWMTFVAAPLAFRAGALVAINAVPNALKGRARQLLLVIIQLVIISLMVAFVDRGSFLAKNAYIQRASTIDLSITYVYIAMPIGALSIALLSLQSLLGSLRRFVDGTSEPAEEEHSATDTNED
jgi:TRAP-type transport system small permease protein